VIDQDGTFLSHPFPEKVGRNIAEEGDRDRFENILENTARGDGAVRHLFNFSGDSTEWLAGFTPVEISISPDEQRIWTVLAVTRLDYALEGLKSISQILALLTGGLLTAHMLAMLYMARDISLPIEKLGKYARHLDRRDVKARMPKNFQVRELNQLADVLNSMVSRLEDRANELESAWQEAEAANQLKSEFLATTSHELRTPLNAIIGCIRLVQDGYCDTREEERELLEQADKAAIHLLKIINDLLDIRGIEQASCGFFWKWSICGRF
jgi:Signal transduction histidine kinase